MPLLFIFFLTFIFFLSLFSELAQSPTIDINTSTPGVLSQNIINNKSFNKKKVLNIINNTNTTSSSLSITSSTTFDFNTLFSKDDKNDLLYPKDSYYYLNELASNFFLTNLLTVINNII